MKKLAVFIATGFYSGLIPPFILKGMAGTYGSIVGGILCYLILKNQKHDDYIYGLYGFLFMVVFLLGIITIPTAEKELGPKTDWHGKTKNQDQNQIVIDEIFGMLTTCLAILVMHVNHILIALLLAFALFRFFDIVKIWPTKYLDELKSAEGVMMDDFMAGIYACICLGTLIFFLKI